MYNEIRRYAPSISEPPSVREPVRFSSMEELLSIDFVSELLDMPGFLRFSMCDNSLMAEFDVVYRDGKQKRSDVVVGTVKHTEGLDFQEWTKKGANR